MKRLLLATASVLAVLAARPALAADLSPYPVKTPPVAPTPFFTWTGCYLGGSIGGGFAHKTFTDTADGSLVDFLDLFGISSKGFQTSGFVGGGQVGCDYQFAQSWVVGVEGDVFGTDLSGSTNFESALTNPVSTNQLHSNTNWLASATGRLGYAAGPWLFYVKGGGAWAHDKFSTTNDIGTWTASETRSGWTVGAGFEWAFTNNWSARVEYDFFDFGSRNLTFVDATGGSPNVESVKQWIQTITFGLNYRFGPGPVSTYY